MRDDTVVIISNYNYGRFVGSAIDSCISQCKVVVVDDASTDNSWNIIKQYVSNYNNVSAIKLNKNSGGNARGKNVGIALTKSEYIVCLDSDDMLLPGSIDCRINLFKPDIQWVHGKSVRVESLDRYYDIMLNIEKYKRDSDITNDVYNKKVIKGSTNRLIRSLPETDIDWYRGVEASTVIARRSIYHLIGLYDEDLKWKIDREMWYRLLKHKYKKIFIDRHVSIYRHHRWQVSRDRIRKPPSKINKMFDMVIKKRSGCINASNSIMLLSYNPYKYIKETAGDI